MTNAGALEEVDWLRNKLEVLEKALRVSLAGRSKPADGAAPQLDPDTLVIDPEAALEAAGESLRCDSSCLLQWEECMPSAFGKGVGSMALQGSYHTMSLVS